MSADPDPDPAAFLETAVLAARAAGDLLRANFGQTPTVNEFHAHDIKLELDVRAQTLITETIFARHPDHALLGEEGTAGNADSPFRWVVDPLDGTVNYFYAIPHFCVSVALVRAADNATLAGVIYDPMREELWAAHAGEHGGEATLNGRPTHVSERMDLAEAIVSVGLSKITETVEMSLPVLDDMVRRVRKCRLMGSAALDLAYVASGRLDAYLENGISIWDVAAGVLLVQRAGGRVVMSPRTNRPGKFAISATSGRIPELAADAERSASGGAHQP